MKSGNRRRNALALKDRHLVGVSLALGLVAAAHDGKDVDVSVAAGGRQHRWVSGAPLDVEAPLAACGQLVQDLRTGAHAFKRLQRTYVLTERRRAGLTSAVLGFQQRILLSFPQLSSSSGSARLQEMARIPLQVENRYYRSRHTSPAGEERWNNFIRPPEFSLAFIFTAQYFNNTGN